MSLRIGILISFVYNVLRISEKKISFLLSWNFLLADLGVDLGCFVRCKARAIAERWQSRNEETMIIDHKKAHRYIGRSVTLTMSRWCGSVTGVMTAIDHPAHSRRYNATVIMPDGHDGLFDLTDAVIDVLP